MGKQSNAPMGNVVQIDEAKIQDHLGKVVRGTVEETLNGLLDAEADRVAGAGRYERSEGPGTRGLATTSGICTRGPARCGSRCRSYAVCRWSRRLSSATGAARPPWRRP